MRLMRRGEAGAEIPALLHSDGTCRDLSGIVADIDGAMLAAGGLAAIAAADPASLPELDPELRVGPCLGGMPRIFGIGLNYADHAAETGQPVPTEPIVFAKLCAPTGPADPLPVPDGATQLDWEVELAVIIGRPGFRIHEADALGHVAGYATINDVSERVFQKHRGGEWLKGKSCDGFAPLGPWFVTADQIADPQALSLGTRVNGTVMQDGSTATMVFPVAHLIAHLSEFVSLRPGDLVITGTPPGVAAGMAPPRWLRPGDVVECEVAGLGSQRVPIVTAARA